jgi:serine/threonine-protein kinase ATR
MDRIHVFESKGNHLDASVCYEEAISKDPENVGLHVGLLKCFTKMGQLSAVLSQVRGLTSKHPDWTSQLLASRVECAWKLNQWDNLKEFLAIADENQHTNNTTPKLSAGKFEFNLGKIFLSLQNEKEDEFKVNLDVARLAEIGPLSAAAMETGSYTSGYQHVVKLQILNELESVAKNFVFNSASESQTTEQVLRKTLTETLKHLESSFDSMQPSYRNHDCLLNFRRTLFFILQGKTKFPVVKKRLGQGGFQDETN